MAEKKFSVVNKLTGLIVFTGTLIECRQKVLTDVTGFLELYV